jgi:nitroreductase
VGLKEAVMDAVEAIRTRRSVRAYQSDSVPRDMINAIIDDAASAPPAFAGQVPWSFSVFEGADKIARWGERALQFARDHRPDRPGWTWTERPDFEVFWGAPVVVIISGPVGDCCRAGQNLMLSAHARGLGTCWVGSPMLWLGDPAVKAELGLPKDLEPVSAICLGYPKKVTPAPASPPRASPPMFWNPDLR